MREEVHHFLWNSDQKAALVERLKRILRSRIWTYFTAHQNRHNLDNLTKIVHVQNKTYHHSTGRVPNELTKKDEKEIRV